MTNPTDEEYIRLGIELADGISARKHHDNGYWFLIDEDVLASFVCGYDNLPEWFIKVLAFQLRDQINAIDNCWMEIVDAEVVIHDYRKGDGLKAKSYYQEGSTALDWIKCIVDSGLLGGGE